MGILTMNSAASTHYQTLTLAASSFGVPCCGEKGASSAPDVVSRFRRRQTPATNGRAYPMLWAPTSNPYCCTVPTSPNNIQYNVHSSRLFATSRLYSSSSSDGNNDGDSSDNDIHDDDTNWVVPDYVDIPEDRLDIKFVRSSGAGGQNVNKVNSQVQIRFHVASANWIGPYEVRQRLAQQQASRINNDGYLVLHVQEHRTQHQNRDVAMKKIRNMILEAWPRPKKRKVRKGISAKEKERRKEFKRRRSQVKESRRRVDF